MGLWQACPETDCPRVLLSQILFLIHLHFNPQSPAGIPKRRSPKTKKAGPSVCVSLCPTLPIANVCHASLRRTTVTFSPPRPHHPPNAPKSPRLFGCMWVTNAAPHKLFPSCWVVATGFGDFILLFIPLSLFPSFRHFVYWASTGDGRSFASLWEDVLYGQRQQGNFYILQIFQT